MVLQQASELLAPAKDKETAFAAIDCGADAVYIGASAFGARKKASNSINEIKEVIDYAHKFWVKVYITINTILTDQELVEAIELIKQLDLIGADAIIIQDMGILYHLMQMNLQIPVHISTQCDNRDLEKFEFFNKLGVSRVVLARELSLDNIKQIHKANPELELEAFVHGALCVSYSGQCYLSQYIGGRSANRGECAQPCRKKYSVETNEGKVIAKDIYALCLKDFNASKHVKQMIESGVFSFKIEGRLKDSNYVKNVTAYYRQLLDKYSQKNSSGRITLPFVPNPEKSFNRGFTDYFLEERKDCYSIESPKSRGEYLGKIKKIKNGGFVLETSKSLHAQDGLTDGTVGFLINKVENGIIYPNKNIQMKLGTKIFRNLDVEFEKELAKKVKRQIGIKVTVDSKINLTDEDNITVELELPVSEKANNSEKMKDIFIKQFSKTGESDFYIESINIIEDVPFLPVSKINELRREAFLILMKKRLHFYKRDRQKKMEYVNFYKKQLDYRANVHNLSAKKFYENCGAVVEEMSLETKLPNRKIEIMRTKHCIKYALNLCKSKENLLLRDEFGVKYPLLFDCKNCEMAILSAQ